MANSVENRRLILDKMANAARAAGRDPEDVALLAVSKTFDANAMLPVLVAGQRAFGENRVQEAQGKWPELKKHFSDIDLHLIGPLQSNKAAEAVALFDVIETVDREKIAAALAGECAKQGRRPKFYAEVNIGGEKQKAGIAPDEAADFVAHCRYKHGLAMEGLMCVPPLGENPGPYFALLAKLAARAGVKKLSMGMSHDFETAIAFGATEVRVGSAIFGERDYAADKGKKSGGKRRGGR